jgi:hypothetical protein
MLNAEAGRVRLRLRLWYCRSIGEPEGVSCDR